MNASATAAKAGPVVALVLALGSLLAADTRGAGPDMAAGSSPVAGGCIESGLSDPGADTLCERQMEDRTRRAPLTPDQWQGSADVVQRVLQAAGQAAFTRCRAGQVPSSQVGACITRLGERPVGPADLDAVRRALADGGFAAETVRTAQPSDPTPAQALVYAVPVGAVCVIAYEWSHGGGAFAGGQYQDGRCLDADSG